MWKNNDYRLRFAADAFYRHEQIILTAGAYDGFLPMTFLREGNGLLVGYDPAGAVPLSRFRIERTADVLYLMEQTLAILHTAPEYLLAPERLTLRKDTLFYHRQRDALRIAFVPHRQGPQTAPDRLAPMTRELLQLLAQMKQEVRDSHADFLLRLARSIYEDQQDTGRMLRCVGLLRRELEKPEGEAGT